MGERKSIVQQDKLEKGRSLWVIGRDLVFLIASIF
jgi:hypothetical protein